MTKNTETSDVENERRLTRRRPVFATFSVFIVVPKKGLHRLILNNVSEKGIFFNIDIEGESQTDSKITVGETLDVRFYLNISLYIPLTIEIKRIEPKEEGRQVGAEICNQESPAYEAFRSFLVLLDKVVEVIDAKPGQ